MFTRHKFMPHFVRFIDGEDGLGGGSEAVGDTIDTSVVVDNDSSTEVNDNPAWNDILSPVPQEFHGHLKEHLSKSDRYTQEVQQRFAPFKEFVDNGISKEDLEQSLQLAHIFQTNPRGLFDFINTQYNYIPAQAQSQQTPEQSQNNSQGQNAEFDISGIEPEFDITKNPQFQQVAQQAQLAEQLANQMQQQQLEAQVNQQIQTEVAGIQQTYPHIPIQEVIKRAVANASISGGREDLEAAAKEIDGYGWFTKSSNPAPPNLSGGGNRALPSSQVNPATMSPEERTRYVASVLKGMNEG